MEKKKKFPRCGCASFLFYQKYRRQVERLLLAKQLRVSVCKSRRKSAPIEARKSRGSKSIRRMRTESAVARDQDLILDLLKNIELTESLLALSGDELEKELLRRYKLGLLDTEDLFKDVEMTESLLALSGEELEKELMRRYKLGLLFTRDKDGNLVQKHGPSAADSKASMRKSALLRAAGLEDVDIDVLMSDRDRLYEYLKKLTGRSDFDLDALMANKDLLEQFIKSEKEKFLQREVEKMKKGGPTTEKDKLFFMENLVNDLMSDREKLREYLKMLTGRDDFDLDALMANKDLLMQLLNEERTKIEAMGGDFFMLTQMGESGMTDITSMLDRLKLAKGKRFRMGDEKELREMDARKCLILENMAKKIDDNQEDALDNLEEDYILEIQKLKEMLNAHNIDNQRLLRGRVSDLRNPYLMSSHEWEQVLEGLEEKYYELQYTSSDELFYMEKLLSLKMGDLFETEEDQFGQSKPESLISTYMKKILVSRESSAREEEPEEPEFKPYTDIMSLSQRRAVTYLENHKILDLFHFLGSHLVAVSPDNPIEFLISLLNKCLEYRVADLYIPAPLLFERKHVESLYFALDPLNIGYIEVAQYMTGMQTLGIKGFKEELAFEMAFMIEKETFINDACERLLLQFNELMQASEISPNYKYQHHKPSVPSLRSDWSVEDRGFPFEC